LSRRNVVGGGIDRRVRHLHPGRRRRWDGLAPAFGRRAEAYRAQGDIDAAIADFDRAIKIDPRKIDNLLAAGWPISRNAIPITHPRFQPSHQS